VVDLFCSSCPMPQIYRTRGKFWVAPKIFALPHLLEIVSPNALKSNCLNTKPILHHYWRCSYITS
jgi:hypothetical protein